MEIWKTIEGYEDYEISNFGNLMSYKNNKKVLIKLYVNKQGYVRITLCKYGVNKTFKMHQLVLKHFGPPQPPNTTPDHINRIKTDNRIENLRWATQKQQTENKVTHRGESHGYSKLTEAQVIEIRNESDKKVSFRTLGKKYGVSKMTIWYIKTGKGWDHIK